MAELLMQQIPAASSGEDSDSAPSAVVAIKAPVVENLLTGRPGKLPLRGPINEFIDLALSSSAHIAGEMVFNNKLFIGIADSSSSTATREPGVAPYRLTSNPANLATGSAGVNNLVINFDNATVTQLVVSGFTPFGRSARVGDFAYGWDYGLNSATFSQNNGVQNERKLIRWDGALSVVHYDNAPRNGQAVRSHLARLFALGGRDIPGALARTEMNTLYWSDPGGPTTDVAGVWQDDVSGLTNKIVVDADDGNDFGVALAKVGANLAIFKRHSVHQLIGSAPSNFLVRPFSLENGCVDQRTIVEYENGCYFLSEQGFMYFDGSQLVNVSEQSTVHSDIIAAIQQTVGDAGEDLAWATASRLHAGHIYLAMGTQASQAGAFTDPVPLFAGIYNTRSRAWSRLSASTSIVTGGAPSWTSRASTKIAASDGTSFMQLNKVATPESCTLPERGFDKKFTTKRRIPAKFHSRLATLSTPAGKSQLHRFFFDYAFSVNTDADDGDTGWYVTLVDGAGDILMPEAQVPSQGAPTSSYLYRRRFVSDVFTEANDVQVRIEYKEIGTNYFALPAAEIYDSWIEYSPARQKSSS